MSDGRLTPIEVLLRAKNRGLDTIALTDHDTVDGIAQAINAGESLNIKVLPGIELSSYDVTEVHILGYNFDYANPALAEELDKVLQMRKVRNYLIVDRLKSFGMNVDLDSIYRQAGHKTVGRPDIADNMVEQGVCPDRLTAFDEYLGVGKKAYVQAKRLTPQEAIQLIRNFGGVPVLAHPKNLKMAQHTLEEYLVTLKEYGLMGIEADYFSHTTSERSFYRSLADKYRLIVTGGSDFHDFSHGGEAVFHPNKYTRKILNLIGD